MVGLSPNFVTGKLLRENRIGHAFQRTNEDKFVAAHAIGMLY
jgi:hypothetical protein